MSHIIFITAGGEGCVAMVYGVNLERMNCDKLFNLFCLYGNVVKVSYNLQVFNVEEASKTGHTFCKCSQLLNNQFLTAD